MQGYDPNLLSIYIGLSKKPHQALSILVIPIHEKMASGPWTIKGNTIIRRLTYRDSDNNSKVVETSIELHISL